MTAAITGATGATRRAQPIWVLPSAPPLNLSHLRELCARHDMEVAPALADQRFYHVACQEDLERISTEGLLPLEVSGRERNFSEYEVDPACVYLWPSVGNAQAYATEHPERFEGRERIILEVQSPHIYDTLCPDQEDLARHWADYEPEWPLQVLADAYAEVGDTFPAPGGRLTFEQASEMVRRLSADTRLLLANFCALQGEALMVRASVPVDELALAELNDYGRLQERFAEENPELSPFNDQDEGDEDERGDREEAYMEAFDDWLLDHLDGGEVIEAEELQERLQDPGELYENDELRYYTLWPLRVL